MIIWKCLICKRLLCIRGERDFDKQWYPSSDRVKPKCHEQIVAEYRWRNDNPED